MSKNTRYVGLDVHAATITAAIAEPDGEVRVLGTIPNRPESVRKLLKKLGAPRQLRVCYEAGPCGYVLYWQLVGMGIECDVVAPSLIPVRPGDRVKTDRRDARKLARCHRSGDLTPVWVPDARHEALRDLVRAREAAKKDQTRARHRLTKLLLRQGRRAPKGVNNWTLKHAQWLRTLRWEHDAHEAVFVDYLSEVDHMTERLGRLEKAIDRAVTHVPESMRALIEALQCLRGVRQLTAVTAVAEVGDFSRFSHPRQIMGYSGAVSSENSTGFRVRRGSITRTGNAHLRRIVGEASWSYRSRPSVSVTIRKRQEGQSEAIKEIAWKAQHRLHQRYCRLVGRGKEKNKAVTAVSRELLGFMWAIAKQCEVERTQTKQRVA